MTIKEWEIHWAFVKFEDSDEVKRRPVLIINKSRAAIVSLKMTGTDIRDTLHAMNTCKDLDMIIATPDKDEVLLSYGDKALRVDIQDIPEEELPRFLIAKINYEQRMTLNDYQHETLRTGKEVGVIESVMGMCEEIGEVVGKINKAIFRGHDADVGELINELGDVLWYLSITAYNAGVPLESVAKLNLAKLKLRYPDGFDIERSKHEEE